MSTPFYVSPEQVMKDRADYARKGISRGRSLLALECAAGVVIVAENPSRTLQKISEIYDRIGFAAVGLYSEYQLLRIAGVRHADLKGYSYSREDVSAQELATAYSQTLHQIFTHEMKPYEVEILVVEVGYENDDHAEMYHVMYDGVVVDEHGYSALGGSAEAINDALKDQYQPGMELGAAVRLGAKLLGTDGNTLARRPARSRAARARPAPPRVPPHQERGARRHPRRLTGTRASARAEPGAPRGTRAPSRSRAARARPRRTSAARAELGIGGRSSSRNSSASSTSSTRRTRLASSACSSGTNTSMRANSPTVTAYGPSSGPRSCTSKPSDCEPSSHDAGAEGPVHGSEARHRHPGNIGPRRFPDRLSAPYTASTAAKGRTWNGASSGSRTSTA